MNPCSGQPSGQTLDDENFEGDVSCNEWETTEGATGKLEWNAERFTFQLPP